MQNKKAAFLVIFTSLLVCETTQASDGGQWSATADFELKYLPWSSDYGYPVTTLGPDGAGGQLYAPVGISASGFIGDAVQTDLSLRSGYTFSSQQTDELEGEASTLTDTFASGTFTYTDFQGVQPFLALSLNIPTGTPALFGSDRFARMDPDMVDVGFFGEGWNFGPTIGANIIFSESFLATISYGATWRGEFDREVDDPALADKANTQAVDPGDNHTITAGVTVFLPSTTLQLSGSYTTENETRVDGAASYEAGDSWSITGSLFHSWSPTWMTSVSAIYYAFDKNEVLNADNSLIAEEYNSNNSVMRIDLEQTYTHEDWTLGVLGNYVKRYENAWDPDVFQYVPAKDIFGVGGSVSYKLNDNASITGKVKHLWLTEYEKAFDPEVGQVESGSWEISLSSVVGF